MVVSREHAVLPACIATPTLSSSVAGAMVVVQPAIELSAEPLSVTWRIDGKGPDATSGLPSFTLRPGRHVLQMLAVRPLRARFYSQQRYVPGAALTLETLRLATNRTFDVTTGTETTTSLNTFGQHVFAAAPLSPFDRWTFELPLDDNPATVSVSSSDVKQRDLSELGDVFLALELAVTAS